MSNMSNMSLCMSNFVIFILIHLDRWNDIVIRVALDNIVVIEDISNEHNDEVIIRKKCNWILFFFHFQNNLQNSVHQICYPKRMI